VGKGKESLREAKRGRVGNRRATGRKDDRCIEKLYLLSQEREDENYTGMISDLVACTKRISRFVLGWILVQCWGSRNSGGGGKRELDLKPTFRSFFIRHLETASSVGGFG
jgi:hypothetical protein